MKVCTNYKEPPSATGQTWANWTTGRTPLERGPIQPTEKGILQAIQTIDAVTMWWNTRASHGARQSMHGNDPR